MTNKELDEIEVQLDSTVSYYVPRLIREIRHWREVFTACPVCRGTNKYDDVYHEHGDPGPAIVTTRACYHCKWVRDFLANEKNKK